MADGNEGGKIVNMRSRTRTNDVGAVVQNGDFNGTVIVGGAPEVQSDDDLLDETLFLKMTRMRASAPARVALRRLLLENVTTEALARIWKDELQFYEDHFHVSLHRWVPWFTITTLVCWALSSVALVFAWQVRSVIGLWAALGWLMLTWQACYLIGNEMRQYYTARKIQPLVERVNQDLPYRLAKWREEKGIG